MNAVQTWTGVSLSFLASLPISVSLSLSLSLHLALRLRSLCRPLFLTPHPPPPPSFRHSFCLQSFAFFLYPLALFASISLLPIPLSG